MPTGWAALPSPAARAAPGTRRLAPGSLPFPPPLLDDNHLHSPRLRSSVDGPLPPAAVIVTGRHGQPEGQHHVSQGLHGGKLCAGSVPTLSHPVGSGTPPHQRRIVPAPQFQGQPCAYLVHVPQICGVAHSATSRSLSLASMSAGWSGCSSAFGVVSSGGTGSDSAWLVYFVPSGRTAPSRLLTWSSSTWVALAPDRSASRRLAQYR